MPKKYHNIDDCERSSTQLVPHSPSWISRGSRRKINRFALRMSIFFYTRYSVANCTGQYRTRDCST